MVDINKLAVTTKATLKEAIKTMDNSGIGLVCVADEKNKLVGIITDGDFRRAILNDISLNENVSTVLNKNFKFVEKGYTKESVQKILSTTSLRQLPVLDNGTLVEIITEEEFFGIKNINHNISLNCPVVIMAGGKGTRLDPYTRILPKPLIPIGDKAMIEVIIDEFRKYNVNEFYISINYKGNMIKAFFEDKAELLGLHYIEENKPLGTAGALKKLEGILKKTFFVINCDVLINDDYNNILSFHKDGHYDLTIVGSMQHHEVPYGVCKIHNGGELKEIIEKPEYDFLVNTGMYVLEPGVLNQIPENEFFHITYLIEKLLKKNIKIGVFPVTEKAWVDVGQLADYSKAIKKFTL